MPTRLVLSYEPSLCSRLRHLASAKDRAIWLRLADTGSEIFSAWPFSIEKHEDIDYSSCELSGWYHKEGLTSLLRLQAEAGAELADIPFRGGWMGLLSYDLLSPLGTHESPPRFPLLLMGDYRAFIHVDHRRQLAELVMLAGHNGAKDDWLDLLAKAMHYPLSTDFKLTQAFEPLTSRDCYRDDVGRILDYLRAGDCYQVNYAQAFHARCSGSGAAAMERLLALSQPAHAAWMCWPEGEVLSLSPELFLSVKDRHIITRPIKGTAPRHPDPATDHHNLTTLRASTKNQAENLMIVDLLRNDLGKHAQTGSVKATQLFTPESLPQVHHLVSTVTATLRQESNVLDLIQDCFPGGSVTGAPKRRAMEIIAELEPTPRTVYCGSIGFINHDGDAELNIAIRTLLRVGDDLYAWAGGGIVADSNWEAEYQECFDKMGAIMRALEEGGVQGGAL